jgi:translation initiation factor 3 subunit G
MEHPDDQLTEDVDDPTIKNTLAGFIMKQQERSLQREADDGFEYEPDADRPIGGGIEPTDSKATDRYIPPGERLRASGGGGGMGSSGLAQLSTDALSESTLRVSNLTKSITEDDLRDLFEPFGRVARVSLPRIIRNEGGVEIKEPRGFAYIAFQRKEDAEAAFVRLQGHGYDHLIIKLEWANQNAMKGGNMASMGSGLSSGFTSGYGKQLIQDTKEKVLYASNLTGNR